jgi:hypothetical protein
MISETTLFLMGRTVDLLRDQMVDMQRPFLCVFDEQGRRRAVTVAGFAQMAEKLLAGAPQVSIN